MKTFFLLSFLVGTLADGEVKIHNQYVKKNPDGSGTYVFSSRKDCEDKIMWHAKISQEGYGENQRLYYEPWLRMGKPDEMRLVLRINGTKVEFKLQFE